MKIYLAGPMTGYPEHNFPAFMEEARLLRAAGYEVVNPAEVNGTHEEACKLSYGECLRNDLKALLECEGLAFLPGSLKSKGASLEMLIAQTLKMEVYPALTWRDPIIISPLGDIG